LATFVFWKFFESFNKLFLNVLGDLLASVAIKDAKNGLSVGKFEISDV
jgi:hypothetical protein